MNGVVYNDSNFFIEKGLNISSTNFLKPSNFFETPFFDVCFVAFGQTMPNRHGNDNQYRYGFEGMERDDEIKGTGNSYDFGARMYDARLGRWLTRDPKEKIYSHLSPYNYCANSPIVWVDKDGNIIRDPKGNIVYVKLGDTQMEHAGAPGVKVATEWGYIFANDGTPILVNKNNNTNGFDTDCHGVTFTKGEFWINNDQVPQLIKSDGLVEVAYVDRAENDKVIYTPTNNEVVDSRTVTSDRDVVYGQGGIEVSSYNSKITETWPGCQRSSEIRIFRSTVADVVKSQSDINKLLKKYKPTTTAQANKLNAELNTILNRSPILPAKTIVEPEVGKLTPLPVKPIVTQEYQREIIVSPPAVTGESKGTKKEKKRKDG